MPFGEYPKLFKFLSGLKLHINQGLALGLREMSFKKHEFRLSRVEFFDDARLFEELSYQGLAYYASRDLPVERLILTSPVSEPLFDYFKFFQKKVLKNASFGWKRQFEFIGVWVKEPHNHMHILTRKPILKNVHLFRRLWADSCGHEGSHMDCTYVTRDKSSRKQMQKLVTYIMQNPIEHQSEDFVYFVSRYWGKPKLTDRTKSCDGELDV